MAFELFIAGRYLRTKRKQTFISLITFLSIAGVAVGVMALVVVIAVMSGAQTVFRSRILGVESHIMVMKHGGRFAEYGQIIEKIEQIKGIQGASAFIYTQSMLRSAHGVSGAMIRGIEPGSRVCPVPNETKASLQKKLVAVQSESDQTSIILPGIILGEQLAKTLGVIVDDLVYLVSPTGLLSPIGHIPTMKRFKVTGIFKSGMYEYDGALAYIHIQDAQKLLHMDNTVSAVGVWIDHIFEAEKYSQEILQAISQDDLIPMYWLRDWMQMNKNLFSALKLEKTAMFIMLTLIILVAAFNIASSLIMLVMEKTKDIAILKIMGATHKHIRTIFMINGIVIGFIGTLIGITFGILICTLLSKYPLIQLPEDIYPFATLPIQLRWLDVTVIGFSALFITFVSTLYPAFQASRQNPVEAIRYG
ncbi:MAG: lipoprotein-releasing ABC transporter permease subunit [Desulfobacterales bacterium]|nr:lipoprotein-releasing ABC transporter permease subunit [Desulfobacterales bacterium]